jgi:hypothetical protein
MSEATILHKRRPSPAPSHAIIYSPADIIEAVTNSEASSCLHLACHCHAAIYALMNYAEYNMAGYLFESRSEE